MPAAGHDLATAQVPGGRERRPRRGKWLVETAGVHQQRLEHRLSHEFRERLPGGVDHQLLHDRVAAAGIAPLAARHEIHPDRRRVRRRLAVEHLHQRRRGGIDRIAWKAVHRQASAVAQEAAQGHLFHLGEFVLGHVPRLQGAVHVGIEGQLPGLDERQDPECGHGLADRTRLEQRVDRDPFRPAGLNHAVALGLHDFPVLNDGEGQTGDVMLRHFLRDDLVHRIGAQRNGRRDHAHGNPGKAKGDRYPHKQHGQCIPAPRDCREPVGRAKCAGSGAA